MLAIHQGAKSAKQNVKHIIWKKLLNFLSLICTILKNSTLWPRHPLLFVLTEDRQWAHGGHFGSKSHRHFVFIYIPALLVDAAREGTAIRKLVSCAPQVAAQSEVLTQLAAHPHSEWGDEMVGPRGQ